MLLVQVQKKVLCEKASLIKDHLSWNEQVIVGMVFVEFPECLQEADAAPQLQHYPRGREVESTLLAALLQRL